MSALSLVAGESSLDGSLDPKLGVVAIRLKCHADDLLTAITGEVPSIGVQGLVENQPRTFARNEAGDQAGYIVEITLEGHLAPDNAKGEEFTLDATTSEDPIESHPEYSALLQIYGGEEDASSGKARWPKTLSAEAADTRNPMHGVESYLVPGLVWTRRWVSLYLPPGMVRSIGTIDQPPGSPPELSGNRNWLKVRARATWRGNIWVIEESWLLSGPDGWVPEMYRHR